ASTPGHAPDSALGVVVAGRRVRGLSDGTSDAYTQRAPEPEFGPVTSAIVSADVWRKRLVARRTSWRHGRGVVGASAALRADGCASRVAIGVTTSAEFAHQSGRTGLPAQCRLPQRRHRFGRRRKRTAVQRRRRLLRPTDERARGASLRSSTPGAGTTRGSRPTPSPVLR